MENENPKPEANRRVFAKKTGRTERFNIKAWFTSKGNPTKPLKYVPREGGHKEEVEPEVPVEVRPDPLPLEPEEARDHWVLQQMPG